jgi:hypothetical protein
MGPKGVRLQLPLTIHYRRIPYGYTIIPVSNQNAPKLCAPRVAHCTIRYGVVERNGPPHT